MKPLLLIASFILMLLPIQANAHSEAEHAAEHAAEEFEAQLDNSPSCSAQGFTIGQAKAEYFSHCAFQYPDCDPIAGGRWMCSASQIGPARPSLPPGVSSPGQVNNPNPPNTPNPPNPGTNPPNSGTDGPSLPAAGNNTSSNIGGSYTGPGPGGVSWMDSFQSQGRCIIDSNFDHGIGNTRVLTPQGLKTVREVAAAQQQAGAPSRQPGDPIYNDVQCGNGPENTAGDEDRNQCPGRVDQGKAGCRILGPKWDLDRLFPAQAPVTPPTPTGNGLRAEAESVGVRGGWRTTQDGIEWDGGNRYQLGQRQDSANLAYVLNVPEAGEYEFRMRSRANTGTTPSEPPNDVWFKFGSTGWIKAYFPKSVGRGVWRTDVTGEHAGQRNKQLLRSNLTVGEHTLTISGRSKGNEIDYVELVRVGGTNNPPVTPPTSGTGRYSDGDQIALHYDSCPDYDDLQAMIAAREMLDEYPDVDFTATNGTKKRLGCNFIPSSTAHMRNLFPSGLDASAQLAATVQTRATEWQLTLSTGNKVWVAEGGPSDVTADIVRELESRGVNNLKNINVIQHSHGWNENNSIPQNISYLVNKTTYTRIDDGNSNNGTPNFNLQGGTFESLARASRYGQEWAHAFSIANAGRKVDFSDTVELMYIFDLPKSHAPNPAAFASRYF